MSSSACSQCPALRQQNAELTAQLNATRARVAWLEQQLGIIIGAAFSALALIKAQLDKATMKRLDLIHQLHGRLQTAVDQVTGRLP